ncbi:MAG TPA: hypothetical protein VJB05_04250 [archaeon]|nr:hypothetical protein [archaeon]
MDNINFFQILGIGLTLFGISETYHGYYIAGTLTALTGAGLAFVEYKIDVAREESKRNTNYLNPPSKN